MYSNPVSSQDWLTKYRARLANIKRETEQKTAAVLDAVERFAKTNAAQVANPGDAVEIVEAAPARLADLSARQVGRYRLPRVDRLDVTEPTPVDAQMLRRQVNTVILALRNHKIDIDCRRVVVSPSAIRMFCRFIDTPGKSTRIADVKAKEQELVLALAVASLRVVYPVMDEPGLFAIEIPRRKRATLTLRDAIETATVDDMAAALPIPVGLTTDGVYRWIDLSKAPHILIAGSTGSGKSVFISSLINALLINRTPEEVRLAMIDVKGELSLYGSIPHLVAPVAEDADSALALLRGILREMDDRRTKMSTVHARDIAQYNIDNARPLPRLVVVIDEAAMLTDPDGVDDKDRAAATQGAIAKIARFARSTGIHLVIGIQRPDVKFLAGEIKSNLPVRVAFKLMNQTDSSMVIGKAGAEVLKGKGDGILWVSDDDAPRFQAPFSSNDDTARLISHWMRYPAPVASLATPAPVVSVAPSTDTVDSRRREAPEAPAKVAPVVAAAPIAIKAEPEEVEAPAAPVVVVGQPSEADALVSKALKAIAGQDVVSGRWLARELHCRPVTAAEVVKALIARGALSADAGPRGYRVVV